MNLSSDFSSAPRLKLRACSARVEEVKAASFYTYITMSEGDVKVCIVNTKVEVNTHAVNYYISTVVGELPEYC